jgi:hypothetical protein
LLNEVGASDPKAKAPNEKARTNIRAFRLIRRMGPSRGGHQEPTLLGAPGRKRDRRRRNPAGHVNHTLKTLPRDLRCQCAYAAFANFSTATVTRAVIGASACSVSLNDASVSLPDSASDFSSAARAKLD